MSFNTWVQRYENKIIQRKNFFILTIIKGKNQSVFIIIQMINNRTFHIIQAKNIKKLVKIICHTENFRSFLEHSEKKLCPR